MDRFFLVTLLAIIPSIALAASFPSGALFLSKTPAIEGEAVRVYSVVMNPNATRFEGEVRVRRGEETIGETTVVLAAGEARAVSVSWTPTAGSHVVAADLLTTDGSVVASERATFRVEPRLAPATPKHEPTAVESSERIREIIANVSPTVAERSEPILRRVDVLRTQSAQFLDEQIAQTGERLAGGGILGTQTISEVRQAPGASLWSVLQTFYFYTLTVLRYLVASAILFYPLLVALFFWILWRLYRRISRPSWAR